MPKFLITKCLTWDELSPEQRAKIIDKNRDIRFDLLSAEEIIWEFSEAGNKIADAGFLNPDVYYDYSCSQGQGACFDCEIFNWELLLEDLDIPHKQLFIKLIENSPAVTYGIRRPNASYAYHYMHEKCRVFFLDWDSMFEDDKKFKRANRILSQIRWHIEDKRLAVSREAFSLIGKAINWLRSDACITEELACNDYYYNEETLCIVDETKLVTFGSYPVKEENNA